MRQRTAALVGLALVGLAGGAVAVLAAHRSDNAYLGLVLLSPALLLVSLPFLLTAVLPNPTARRTVLVGGLAVLLVLILIGSVAFSAGLALVPVGLLLLVVLGGALLLVVSVQHQRRAQQR
jgi:peptidoglycan/LPS O-acetylase OafA/YrhL